LVRSALRRPRWLAARSALPFWYPEKAFDFVPVRACVVAALALGWV